MKRPLYISVYLTILFFCTNCGISVKVTVPVTEVQQAYTPTDSIPSIPTHPVWPPRKKKICPDEWYVLYYPDHTIASEFFILNGKRMAIEQFDLAWVNENCHVKRIASY